MWYLELYTKTSENMTMSSCLNNTNRDYKTVIHSTSVNGHVEKQQAKEINGKQRSNYVR